MSGPNKRVRDREIHVGTGQDKTGHDRSGHMRIGQKTQARWSRRQITNSWFDLIGVSLAGEAGMKQIKFEAHNSTQSRKMRMATKPTGIRDGLWRALTKDLRNTLDYGCLTNKFLLSSSHPPLLSHFLTSISLSWSSVREGVLFGTLR